MDCLDVDDVMRYCGTGEGPSVCRTQVRKVKFQYACDIAVVAASAGTYFAFASCSASSCMLRARDRARGDTRLVSAIAVQ